MKKLLSLFLLFTVTNTVLATDISVRIFADKTIRKIEFTCISGQYSLSNEDGKEIVQLYQNDSITLQAELQGVKILKDTVELGVFKKLTAIGEGQQNIFNLWLNNQTMESRTYDDYLELSVEHNALRLINIVELEDYVAGVYSIGSAWKQQ